MFRLADYYFIHSSTLLVIPTISEFHHWIPRLCLLFYSDILLRFYSALIIKNPIWYKLSVERLQYFTFLCFLAYCRTQNAVWSSPF
jgi:hypothetical protein